MIITIVHFNPSSIITVDQAHALFEEHAPRYQKLPGLMRKYFLLSEDGQTIGGVYLWKTRQDAERFYNSDFKQFILTQFGCEPTITYFEAPVIVDNVVDSLMLNYSSKLINC